MTVIAAAVDASGVWMAGDTRTTADYEIVGTRAIKVRKTQHYVLGCAGGARGSQLIITAFTPPDPPATRLVPFMVTTFATALRTFLDENGLGSWGEAGINLLVGVHGDLFWVDDQLAINRSTRGFEAIGSGMAYAAGALFATADRADTEARLRLACEIAAACDTQCGGEVDVVHLASRRRATKILHPSAMRHPLPRPGARK